MTGGSDYPDVGNGDLPCCMGSSLGGPAAYTCWRPVYDQEQQPTKAGPARVRLTMCHDCAFRHDSPERRGEEGYDNAGAEGLAEVVAGTFVCHQGIRRRVADVHPSGARVEAMPGDYMPPGMGRDGFPVRADGCPAELCAGWWAARQRLERAGHVPGTQAHAAGHEEREGGG